MVYGSCGKAVTIDIIFGQKNDKEFVILASSLPIGFHLLSCCMCSKQKLAGWCVVISVIPNFLVGTVQKNVHGKDKAVQCDLCRCSM